MEKNESKEGNEEFEVTENKISSEDFDEVSEGRILNTRLIALFVIGALIGITLKTHAVRTITMGFEDYKLARYSSDFGQEEPPNIDEEVSQEEALDDVEDELIEEDVQLDTSEEINN